MATSAWTPDLIATYWPALTDITDEQAANARTRLQAYMQVGWPDVDLRPGSPLGDLGLTPFAYLVAGAEIAMGRFMSDLDLDQVAKGIIFNCLGIETPFITRDGVRAFADFKSGDRVCVLTHTGGWQYATVRNYGNDILNTVSIRRGKVTYTVRATKSHRWLLSGGKETTTLKAGDRLQFAPNIFSDFNYDAAPPDERMFWAYGYVFGDGTVCGEKWSMVRVCKKDQDFLTRFQELGFNFSVPKSCAGDPIVYTGHYRKEIPDLSAEEWRHMRAFVAGYLDADGTLNQNWSAQKSRGKNGTKFTAIQATGEAAIEFIRKVFPAVGVYIVSENDVTNIPTNFGPRSAKTVRFSLTNGPISQTPPFVVDAVTEGTKRETVWCLEVDNDRSFVMPNGLVTGNCDFVKAYLANFGVYDQASLQSTGAVRLTFNTDAAVTIDRRTRFRFGASDFTLRLDFDGQLQIYPVGSQISLNSNARVLSDIGGGLFAADVYVRGDMGAAVLAGDTAELDAVITSLVSAVAVTAFAAGEPASSLPILAQKTRERFYAANLCSRRNAVSYMQREFPELLGASAVMPGDAIMLRASVNALGIDDARVDLHARSSQYDFLTTQTIRLQYFEEQDSVSVQRFIGRLQLTGNPTRIKSLTSSENASVVLFPENGFDIYSRSSNAAKAPLLTAAGTDYEQLWVAFSMPKHPTSGADLITTSTDSDGTRWAEFIISYYYDPLFPAIASRVNSPSVKPAGVDVLARPFITVEITQFEVQYTLQAGVSTLLDQARAEILSYLRGLTYPQTFSMAKIGDAMYYAGADDVKRIKLQARVWWSAATQVLPADSADLDVDYAAAVAGALTAPIVLLDNAAGLVISDYTDPEFATEDATLAAIGVMNLVYLIDAETITFSEVLQ